MSNAISPSQLRQMRRSNTERMMDRVVIINYTVSKDATGQEIKTYTDDLTIDCGFGFSPFKFRSRELGTLGAEESSEILVRARVSIEHQDRINTTTRLRLTHRYGVKLATPQTYEVQGFNEVGPSGMVINLKRVQL